MKILLINVYHGGQILKTSHGTDYEARGLVRKKFPTVQPSYNKLWRERELTIADIFGS
jgi:hypothetical protein